MDWEAAEEEGGAATEGLTSLRLWAPPGAVTFKTSAACPSPYDDWYGIYAVFTDAYGDDHLWFLVIDGLSGSPEYGRMVRSCQVPIGDATTIDRLDCSHDPFWVYAVFDRLDGEERLAAQWVRASPYTCEVQGPHTVRDCGQNPPPPATATPFVTSIAVHDDVVAIPNRSTATCGFCVDEFRTNGEHIRNWPRNELSGGSPISTDIEWNDDGVFLVAILYPLDPVFECGGPGQQRCGPPTVVTALFGSEVGIYSACDDPDHYVCEVYLGALNDPREDLELVYSPNDYNTYDRMVIQTDRQTIWIEQDGVKTPGTNNPQKVGPWSDSRRASCEVWSDQNPEMYRIAHTYHVSGASFTQHVHWHRNPLPAQESYTVRNSFYPDSCASSDGYDDAEVLLVSRSALAAYRRYVCYNMEYQE